jgi:hypothetical protein
MQFFRQPNAHPFHFSHCFHLLPVSLVQFYTIYVLPVNTTNR